MSERPKHVWQPITTKHLFDFNKGELLAPCIQHNNSSLIFIVEHVEMNGFIHLRPHSEKILKENRVPPILAVHSAKIFKQQWYFVPKSRMCYFGSLAH